MVDKKSEELRDLPCPICGSEEYKLNAVKITTVVSFITITNVKDEFHFGCYNCLQAFKQKAKDKTSLLGWWGIYGITTSHRALKSNDKVIQDITLDKPTEELREYAYGMVTGEFKEQ